jgi:hypothetical protein
VHGSVEEDEMTVRLPLDEPTTAAPEVPLDTIEVALTRGFALEIAPPWIVERGIAYVEEGRVHDVQVEPTQVHALVDGSEPYEVHLSREDDDIRADCTCPMVVRRTSRASTWSPSPSRSPNAPRPPRTPLVAPSRSRRATTPATLACGCGCSTDRSRSSSTSWSSTPSTTTASRVGSG